MGIRVNEPSIVRILRDHGFSPRPGRKVCFDRVRAAAKDALWALDFFWMKSAKRVWLQALLVIDIHTRELLDVRVHDGWGVDCCWANRHPGVNHSLVGSHPARGAILLGHGWQAAARS